MMPFSWKIEVHGESSECAFHAFRWLRMPFVPHAGMQIAEAVADKTWDEEEGPCDGSWLEVSSFTWMQKRQYFWVHAVPYGHQEVDECKMSQEMIDIISSTSRFVGDGTISLMRLNPKWKLEESRPLRRRESRLVTSF